PLLPPDLDQDLAVGLARIRRWGRDAKHETIDPFIERHGGRAPPPTSEANPARLATEGDRGERMEGPEQGLAEHAQEDAERLPRTVVVAADGERDEDTREHQGISDEKDRDPRPHHEPAHPER